MDRFRTSAADIRRICLLALLLWLVAGTVRTYPFYLAYFNELIGGPGNGYKYLTDSNLDWGQDLRGLSAYLRRNRVGNAKLAYFGSEDPRTYGIAYEPLMPGQPTTGYVAVSVTELTGTREYPACVRAFEWLRRYEPIAKIGYSIFVYRISENERLPPAVPIPECKHLNAAWTNSP